MTEARVLAVDGDPLFLERLDEVLTEAGHPVLFAKTCRTARRLARRGFDVAVLDLQLSDGTGTELASELRHLNPDAAVVLMTGNPTHEAAAAAVRAGAFAYLAKPCATPELVLTVQQACLQVSLQREKRELARRAQMAERLAAVGTMTAGLSHEIRNPLNAAGLQLSVLERRIERLGQEERPGLLGPLQLVRDEIWRLDRLVEDFLQLARPPQFHARPVDLSALAARVLDLLALQAQRREVQLQRRLEDCPPVHADDGRLRQVVMNLALNALEASPPGGCVTVEARSRRETVELTVDDQGAGVPHELRERIFEPFFTTKAQGTGLGLPIVHAIVLQHGGTLTVADAPGGGARFAVTLPAA